ncbi:MAG TPA: M48 family metalloprotease [Terriglobales bacterium]|nr:M48 family metalloprotease [Terriglobales bacterium]
MKKATLLLSTLLLASMALAESPAVTEEQAIDRFIAREQLLVQNLHNFSPLVETYIQHMRPDAELGSVPEKDEYFLGRMQLTNVVRQESYSGTRGRPRRFLDAITGMFTLRFAPEGFDGLVLVDGEHFDRAHYDFRFVRREFLGDIRTLVYDVTPKKGMKSGFLGRIWVEDQEFNIVRFNGTHQNAGMFQYQFHFDSWRQNVRPGLWLPTVVYNEESGMKVGMFRTLRFKSQTRLWGYDPHFNGLDSELTSIKVESKTGAQDHSQTADEYSPLLSQRMFEGEAEQNLVERLERAGLIAPKGEVDKVLDTVVNNLEITNNLDIQPEVRCRVLLTSPLESFTVGHTIVLSRGLIDTLPDEASLAAVLARELAHITLGHRLDTKYSFADRTLFADAKTFQSVSLRRTEPEEVAADTKAIALLKNSPYSAKMGNAGLFLRQLQARAGSLPSLTTPRIGNPMIQGERVVMSELASSAPQLEMQRTEQVAALPLGARVKLDPWSNSIELLKARPVPVLSAREKMPFEVTPLRPYLKRLSGDAAAPETAADATPQTAAADSVGTPTSQAAPATDTNRRMNIVHITDSKQP